MSVRSKILSALAVAFAVVVAVPATTNHAAASTVAGPTSNSIHQYDLSIHQY